MRCQGVFIRAVAVLSAVFMVLVPSALAHVVEVLIVDPLGNSVSGLQGLRVELDAAAGTVGVDGRFVFTDVVQGFHTLTVSVGDETVHSRSLYIEREEIALTVSLPWTALSDPEWSEDMIALPNSSFEEPMADGRIPAWSPSQAYYLGTVLQTSAAHASHGEYSLRIDGEQADKSIWIRSEKMPAAAGMYMASADVYCEKKEGPNPQLYLEFWNEANTRIDLQYVRTSGRVGEWETVVLRANAPAQTAYVTVWFYCNTNYTGVTYWDNVKLARLDH